MIEFPVPGGGPLNGTRGPLKGPRGPLKGPRGTLQGPRGPFNGSQGPLKGPRGPFLANLACAQTRSGPGEGVVGGATFLRIRIVLLAPTTPPPLLTSGRVAAPAPRAPTRGRSRSPLHGFVRNIRISTGRVVTSQQDLVRGFRQAHNPLRHAPF